MRVVQQFIYSKNNKLNFRDVIIQLKGKCFQLIIGTLLKKLMSI